MKLVKSDTKAHIKHLQILHDNNQLAGNVTYVKLNCECSSGGKAITLPGHSAEDR